MSKSLEVRIDDWVLTKLKESGLSYYQENDLPPNYVRSLANSSKHGTGTGRPDFAVTPTTTHRLAVVIENKWGLHKLEVTSKDGDYSAKPSDIRDFAVNGVLHYAYNMIASKEFDEVIAIAIAGEGAVSDPLISNKIFYVYDEKELPKLVEENIEGFNFLKAENFEDFYKKATLTEEEKHKVLIKSYDELKATAKKLNKLMNDNSITVDQRVIYVSGFLLAMNGGLTPDDLKGADSNTNRSDGKLIFSHIEDFLTERKVEPTKAKMMMSIFNILKVDSDRDTKRVRQIKLTGKNRGEYEEEYTMNSELFNFIFYNVFKKINEKSHIDTLGEMYSEFLKYAMGDGKENGIVLTPPYVTKMMNKLINVNRDTQLLDLCTGSGGFLVAGMTEMIDDAKNAFKYESKELLDNKIKDIKKKQLMGVELDLKMFTLASTNMILRGDGSSTIFKNSAFDVVKGDACRVFKADKCLLNPPFSYSENGMPFVLEGLNVMEKGGLLAVIIQDSAGSGKAPKTNKLILRNNTLKATIQMPADLFQPNAGVQTSIYIIEAGIPHDYRRKVRFIDFSKDGYKRTGRGLREIDNPTQKYSDILDVYISGDEKNEIEVIDDYITDSGADWNYTQHKVYNTIPEEQDFIATVSEYLQFEISQLLKGGN